MMGACNSPTEGVFGIEVSRANFPEINISSSQARSVHIEEDEKPHPHLDYSFYKFLYYGQ